MRVFFYTLLISQLLNFLDVFAQKVIEDSTQLNSVKWEKLENKSKPLKKIIWRSYNNDESYFEDQILENKIKPPIWRNRTLRFSFEEIDMPDEGEQMGLYSIGAYDRLNPWLYGGVTLYGAATGRRGGFFTGGYTLGLESELVDNFILDAGYYVGAGGGGSAAQGGGLMLRPHIGVKYDFGWTAVGLNYTYVTS